MQKKCLHCCNNTTLDNNFCCNGCKTCYSIINNLNLEDYYHYCKEIFKSKPMKIKEIENNLLYIEHVTKNEDVYSISLIVEGIKCGSCVWLIENALKKDEDVQECNIKTSTNRMTIKWRGDKDDILKYIKTVSDLGYKLIPYTQDLSASNKEETNLLKAIAVAGFGLVQLMMINMGIWFAAGSMEASTITFLNILSSTISIPVIIYSGNTFFKSAFTFFKTLKTNMDIPISIGILATVAISVFQLIDSHEALYFDSAIMLIFALLIGRYLDQTARNKAKELAKNLILSQPTSATVIRDGKLLLIDIKQILVTDIIEVAAGEKIPVDGEIIEGQSDVDNSIITGESKPIPTQIGSTVFAGSINISSPLKIKINQIGESTVLNEIITMVENAGQSKSKYVQIADKFASSYTPFILIISSLITIIALLLGCEIYDSILRGAATLIITCPCALGLAVPTVQIIASSTLLKHGIYIKSQDALERMSKITEVIFDKTGTLTTGKLHIHNLNDFDEMELSYIKSLSQKSKHPLCKVMKEIDGQYLDLEVQEEPGMGLKSNHNNIPIVLGNRKWVGIETSDEQSYTQVWLKIGNQPPKCLLFEDQIKDDSIECITTLKQFIPQISIFSGDNKNVVKAVADKLEIKDFKAEMTPKDKLELIKQKQTNSQEKVLMVGDGLNDSAALKEAFSSISLSSALDITQQSSDFVITKEMTSIPLCYLTAKKSVSLIKQNFTLSMIYNLASIPIAALGYVSPPIAALFMSFSSITVIFNSFRVKNVTLNND